MRNIFSLVDFIDNSNNIIFDLAKKFRSKYALYLIEEFITSKSFEVEGTTFIKASRYPIIKTPTQIANTPLSKSINLDQVEIGKVLERFASQLNLSSKSDYQNALNSLINYSNDLIKKYDINLILYNDYPHTPLEIVLYFIAKKLNIEIYFLFPVPRINPIEERFFLTTDFKKLPDYFWLEYKNIKETSNFDINSISVDLQNYYKEYTGKIKINNYYFGNKTSRLLLLKRYLLRFPISVKQRGLKLSIEQAIKRIQYITPIHNYQKSRILKYAEKISYKTIQYDEQFIFFPLHYQPEANTIPWGNIYSDQLYAITEISKALPDDYILYVKEHPTYWKLNHIENFSLYRSEAFYTKIAKLKNVRLISYKIPSYRIIDKAQCVITISGTIAWEAFYKSVPCIVLGDIYYKEFPTSISPDLYNHNLADTINDALSKIGNDYSNDFKKFLITFDKTTVLTNNPIAIGHSWHKPTLTSEEETRYITTNKIKADYIYNQLK